MATARKNEAKSKAWVVEEDEFHPDPRVAAQAVDEKAYHKRGKLAPWEDADE